MAALVRIMGSAMAELPLAATRAAYRRLGHCRALVAALEDKLLQLGVRVLALPATNDAVRTGGSAGGCGRGDAGGRAPCAWKALLCTPPPPCPLLGSPWSKGFWMPGQANRTVAFLHHWPRQAA